MSGCCTNQDKGGRENDREKDGSSKKMGDSGDACGMRGHLRMVTKGLYGREI